MTGMTKVRRQIVRNEKHDAVCRVLNLFGGTGATDEDMLETDALTGDAQDSCITVQGVQQPTRWSLD